MNEKENNKMDKIVSLCKRRGFVFQGSEIYGGLRGTWDLGPLGVALNNNLKREWWKMFVDGREDMYGLDASILMNGKVWDASGHTGAGFCDPLVEDTETGERYRADHLLKDAGHEADGLSLEEIDAIIVDNKIVSPNGNPLSPARQFNLMFESRIGATAGDEGRVYLRPETAQGIFVNFKNVVDTGRVKVPFGIAQVGKAFRNEITPRNFIFRSREFEQMEIEYFIPPDEDIWERYHREWIDTRKDWFASIGLTAEHLGEEVHPRDKLAHYARACTDITFKFPFGEQELEGIAARGNYDLIQHQEASGKPLEFFDEGRKEKYVPHVIEPSLGVDRTFLAVVCAAYTKDEIDGEQRTVLKLHPRVAPVKAGVFPLMKNKPELMEKARSLYEKLRRRWNVFFDVSGAIGRRYRRMDEIGTPFGITVDFDSLDDGTVTLRDRDTTKQQRVSEEELISIMEEQIGW